MLSGQVKYIRVDFHYTIKQMHNLKLIEIKLKIYRFTIQMASISQVGQSCIPVKQFTTGILIYIIGILRNIIVYKRKYFTNIV